MHVTHELTINARCPKDDAFDHYAVTVETDRTVAVEDILKAAKDLPEKIFQEEITQRLAEALSCKVRTVGTHSGVKTTCSVG